MAVNGKPHEATPLLPRDSTKEPVKYGKSVAYRALLCGFLVSLSFGVTQVPLIYVFRVMTCEAYYKTHPEPPPGSDRCSNHDIEAGTARAVSLLGASTTLFGVANLFVTNWTIKKFGIKAALFISVFWPAVRLAVQNIGVMMGGGEGIIVVQASQIITIVGGPAGYLLALNSYVSEVVEPSERTGSLGKLQGCAFIGTASAYLAGGLIADAFGIIWPFRVTVILFLSSCAYILVFLPWLPLNKDIAATKTATGIRKFFGPVKTLAPQKWTLRSGVVQTQYGALLLSAGVFLGILATGYIPVLLQMYATDIFAFGTTENGYLISLNSFIRGLFLTLAFPRIISAGRNWVSKRAIIQPIDTETETSRNAAIPDLPHEANDFVAIEAMDDEEEPVEPPKLHSKSETFAFDLTYTRYSLLADAIITGGATFIRHGWQMYLIAVLLPLASGSGASAKGTILQMCSPEERTDALSAITLIEMIARLATTSIFGLIFGAFAEVGQTYLVFTCNGAIALIGFGVLMFSHFPPDGSTRFEEVEEARVAEHTVS